MGGHEDGMTHAGIQYSCAMTDRTGGRHGTGDPVSESLHVLTDFGIGGDRNEDAMVRCDLVLQRD